MRILGGDLSALDAGRATLVALGPDGSVETVRRATSLPSLASIVGELSAGEPFVLGINLPVMAPAKASRSRPVENVVRRRLGTRLRPGGRTARRSGSSPADGEAVMTALAAAGHPCLPYPDRDRRRSGLAEIYAELVLKVLLWESTSAWSGAGVQTREEIFRATTAPPFRPGERRARTGWGERAVALEQAVRLLSGSVGYDLPAARTALASVDGDESLAAAAALLDAVLIAGTARRYMEEPEACAFLGDRESGYVILPADGFVRRLAIRETSRPARAALFPSTSLRERLGTDADVRAVDLLDVPGRPQQLQAAFRRVPLYEFDNVDEMVWWKHCRHLSGPELPIEGLREMAVTLGADAAADAAQPLRLVRSRHRVLSFRFDPPSAWRRHLPTRDGRTYAFRVLRAVFETAAPRG